MTNKKLKMAAMSVALTACVAASPLAANADAPEATSGEPKTEPVAEETKKEENTAEPQVNQEAKNAQETLKDAEVKYNKDNPTTNPDGSQKLDGVIVTNPEGSGETGSETGGETGGDPNPNPDSSETKPGGETGSGETGSGETGSGETGSGETGSGETGSGETGSGETGSGETGSGETGSGETGSGETGSGETGSGETGSGETGSGETGSGETGSGETGSGETGSGETGSGETGSSETGSGETDTGEKKPEKVEIGTAEKTEKSETTVETNPKPGAKPIEDTTTPPTVEKNPDGSSTITQTTVTPGTETTTTTGTGTAKGDLDTVVTETPKEKIDLEKELGKVNPDISWNIEKGADAVNGYKVEEVTNSPDGNQQTLKLRKEEETTAEMTAEDIAKLVDAEKPTVNPDGTYTLTRTETILDAEGNPQTRTTYITIQDNKVTTKTTTELTITRKKAEQDGSESFRDEVTYPSIQIKDGDKVVETIQPEDLEKMLNQGTAADDGIHFTKDDKEYVIQETTQPGETKLSNAEIVDRLKKDGNKNYELGEDGEIYYTTPHNEKVKLDVTQNELLRRSLTYTVTLTTTEKGDPGTAGEQDATENARRDATRDALTKAVDALGVDEATASQLKAKISGLPITKEQLDNGDTFEVTLEDGKKYTLTYSAAGATVTSTPTEDKTDTGKKPEDITDVYDNTVTGKAYVTGSKITYQAGAEYKTTGVDTLGIGADFKTAPKDADPDSIQKDTAGRITSYKDKQGNTHSFTYEENVDLNALTLEEKTALEAAANKDKDGWTTKDLTANLTRVKWTVKAPDTEIPQTTPIENGTPVDLSEKTWSSQNGNNETVDFITHDNKTYAGMTLVNTAEDGTKTYKKTDDKGTVTIITVTTRQLGEEEIKAKFGSNFISLNLDDKTVTYTGEDGKTYTARYVAQEEKLTVEVQKPQPDVVTGTGSTKEEAENAFHAKLDEARKKAEDDGEQLVIEYDDNGVIKTLIYTSETKWEEVIKVVGHVVNYNAMTDAELTTYLKELETAAKNTGKYYNGATGLLWDTMPYYWDDDTGKMQRVPPEKEIKWDWRHGNYYVEIDGKKYEVRHAGNYIEHLDLATDSKLTLSEKTEDDKPQTTDCVLVNPKLEWNYSAEHLLADQSKLKKNDRNKNVGLDNKISYDKSGHYEYDRDPYNNNNPNASAFYKVTGTVAYDAVKDDDGNVQWFTDREEAVKAYLTAVEYGKTYEQLNEREKQEILSTYVVEIGPSTYNGGTTKGYHVYKKSSTMTAYGYMSDDNNTCGNALFAPGSKYNYVGGYDLTLGNLTQTDKNHVVAMGKNTIALSTTIKRRKLVENLTNRELRYTPISETVTVVTPGEETTGSELSGSYSADYTKTVDYTDKQQKDGIAGTGEGHYKSFTNLIHNVFNGQGNGTVESGFIKYEYHTEKNKDGTPVQFEAEQMVVTTKQDAEVHYTFTSQESRDVWIKGYTQTVVPPVNPGPDSPELPPVEDAKPAPAPEAPVLPVVQDARPDPAPAPAPAPETPVLPAVQDAKLIQTGTSGWLADLMLGAGMVLSAAGYWMERKRKAMFYKSQH